MEALTYTHQVIDEALRLYPPGWLLSRRTIAAGHAFAATTIPAGTDVLLSALTCCTGIRGTGKSPTLPPGALRCRNTRPSGRVLPTCPLPPGPRHCIGETLALYEMLMHLYKVARRYRLTYVPDQPIELEAQINLRTRHPLFMRLERR